MAFNEQDHPRETAGTGKFAAKVRAQSAGSLSATGEGFTRLLADVNVVTAMRRRVADEHARRSAVALGAIIQSEYPDAATVKVSPRGRLVDDERAQYDLTGTYFDANGERHTFVDQGDTEMSLAEALVAAHHQSDPDTVQDLLDNIAERDAISVGSRTTIRLDGSDFEPGNTDDLASPDGDAMHPITIEVDEYDPLFNAKAGA